MGQVRGLVAHELLPSYCTYGKTKSLYLQGASAWTTGITTRPNFREQAVIFDILRKYLVQYGGQTHALPDMCIDFAKEPWGDDMRLSCDSFKERERISKLAMKRVREARKRN